jgi:hypothetical protein
MAYALALRIPFILWTSSVFISAGVGQSTPKRPADYVNTLVGTAPLDQPKLVGNAPPPGEPVYSGQTSPGAPAA